MLFKPFKVFQTLFNSLQTLRLRWKLLTELLLEISRTKLFIAAEKVRVQSLELVHLYESHGIQVHCSVLPKVFFFVLSFSFADLFVVFLALSIEFFAIVCNWLKERFALKLSEEVLLRLAKIHCKHKDNFWFIFGEIKVLSIGLRRLEKIDVLLKLLEQVSHVACIISLCSLNAVFIVFFNLILQFLFAGINILCMLKQFCFKIIVLSCKIKHFIDVKSVLASILVVINSFFHGLFVFKPRVDVLTFNLVESKFPLLFVFIHLCGIILIEVASDQEGFEYLTVLMWHCILFKLISEFAKYSFCLYWHRFVFASLHLIEQE